MAPGALLTIQVQERKAGGWGASVGRWEEVEVNSGSSIV